MATFTKAYILAHIAVILFGFTAILGAWIDLHAIVLVWWRVLIAAAGFTLFTRGFGFLRKIPKEKIIQLAMIGAIIAIHWSAFFGSVKLAGASVCLVCMATTSVFVSIIEPFILKKRFNTMDFAVALLIIPGMWLVVQNVESGRLLGVLLGLISAALAALFSSLNKKYISAGSVWEMSWIEMMSAWLTLGIIILGMYVLKFSLNIWPSQSDWLYLVLLGLGCTTIGHALALFALKQISAFSLNLVLNLEPLYGIILAIGLLKENKTLNTGFYIGATLIILAIFIHPIIKKKMSDVI